MLALRGIFENGVIKLERPLKSDKPLKVIVTFLEEDANADSPLDMEDFSFLETRKKLKKYKFSLADEVVEERNEER